MLLLGGGVAAGQRAQPLHCIREEGAMGAGGRAVWLCLFLDNDVDLQQLRGLQFPVPADGDWVLRLRSGLKLLCVFPDCQ